MHQAAGFGAGAGAAAGGAEVAEFTGGAADVGAGVVAAGVGCRVGLAAGELEAVGVGVVVGVVPLAFGLLVSGAEHAVSPAASTIAPVRMAKFFIVPLICSLDVPAARTGYLGSAAVITTGCQAWSAS